MTFELTDKEHAVFDAIKAQRDRFANPNFTYDLCEGQKYLNEANASFTYGIELDSQLGIIKELAEKGILELDWIIEKDIPNKIDGTRFWLSKNKDWAQDLFMHELLFSHNEKHQNICFINLDYKKIIDVDENRKIHKAKIKRFVRSDRLIIISCEGEEYKVKISKDASSRPFLIISYAINKLSDKKIDTSYKKELNEKALKKDKIKKNESVTSVFQHSPIIKDALSPFFTLKSDHIKIAFGAELTYNELKKIKAVTDS